MYRKYGKRALDLSLSVLLLALLSPVLLVIALVVRRSLGTPVLFSQQRPGKDETPYTIYKFRTMTADRNDAGELLPDKDRLTQLGRFLRTTSLDELPELINVLKGEMSLVGPRPLLMRYLPRYTSEQRRRHEVLPGITGWAQVNGRNELSWDEKFAHDIWYVDNLSLGLDLKILLRTVAQVLRRRGISQPGEATAREFEGN
jgi:lipopolysaccharide/colanic/teichoic acid biosynthesis glycosyltransferase